MMNIVELSGAPKSDKIIIMRSVAKPLQASLIIDYNLDFMPEEIALCCASHTGEKIHTSLAQSLLNRLGLKKSLLLVDFEHNCIGKHIMMLELCRLNAWSLEDYWKSEHPLQIQIAKKISSMCEIPSDGIFNITKDGCGVPAFCTKPQNILKGFLNLPEKIIRAMSQYPYIVGGDKKLDTKIMQLHPDLIAKNGAGGLCVVMNSVTNKALFVQVKSGDNDEREKLTLEHLFMLE
jgi:L-asparaginase II